jgi:AraC-like DNA-binding protein
MTLLPKTLAQQLDVILEDARQERFPDKKQHRRMTLDTVVSRVLEGEYEIEHPDGHYFVGPGEVYLHQANIPVSITHHVGSSGRMESQWVRFHALIYKAHDVVSCFSMPLKVSGKSADEIGSIIDEMIEIVNRDPEDSAMDLGRFMHDAYRVPLLLNTLMQIIISLSTPKPEGFRQLKAADSMAPVLQYIHRNLAEHISVEDLAAVACMSESHFYAAFKQAFGEPPIQYIRLLRIREASRLLVRTRDKVQDIAEATGFGSTYYFSRAFKALLGVSPNQYRKINSSLRV